MYRLIQDYLDRLPGSKRTAQDDAHVGRKHPHTPHSLRATTATLLLDSGVDMRKVQELLGNRHITTTRIYDKRRRRTAHRKARHMRR